VTTKYEVFEKYIIQFSEDPPIPMGIDDDEVVKVVALHMALNKPIPDDYDWYEDLPDRADA